MRYFRSTSRAAFSIIEVLVAGGIFSLVTLVVLMTGNLGLNIFTRVMAINSSHVEARSGIQSLLGEIHNSVSAPQLVDIAPIDGTTYLVPAAKATDKTVGVVLQRMVAGPFGLNDTAAPGTQTLKVRVVPQNQFVPTASGMILVPGNGIEKFISAVSSYSDDAYPILIEDADGLNAREAVKVAAPSAAGATVAQDSVVLAYFTQPVAFVAVDGELRRYLVEHDASTGKPFLVGNGALVTAGLLREEPDQPGVPYAPFAPAQRNSSGATDASNVAAINIFADDPKVSNLGYTGTSMFLNAKIPLRFKLAARNTVRPAGSEAN